MKKNIYTAVIITIVLVFGGVLSSCVAQQATEPKPSASRSPEVPEKTPAQPAPAPAVPTPVVPLPPRIPVPVAPPSAPQLGRGETPPPVSSPQAPSPAPVPERRLLPTPAAPGPSGGMISLNFTRADLVEIVHIIAQHLRLTYTIDPEVKGTVTINSAEPLRSEDLLPIFHQVLRMNGAVAVRSGNIYRIVPIKDGKSVARPIGQSREDSFALQIVPVRFFTVAEMKRLLTPFLMAGGEIIENPRGNFLIVIDLPSNIQRLVEITDLIDVQVFAGTRMEIYQPKIASAEELAQEMAKVMQSFAASVPQTDSFAAQFIALPRINQLLVISHSEAAWTYAKRWLERIDVVAEGPGRRIFIYPVENSKATELADVLGQALGLPISTARTSGQTLQSLHRSTTGGTGTGIGTGGRTTSPAGSGGLQSTQQPGGLFAAIPAPGQPVPPTAPQPPPVPQPGQPRPVAPSPAAPGAKPEEQLRIVADPGTNSLIIYGTVQEFQNIKNILKELDAVPRQVLLDVLVAEVTLSDNESFGVDYQILGRNSPSIFGQRFGSSGAIRTLGTLFPTTRGFGTATSQATGLSGVFGGGDVKAIINALQSDSRFKVLSSPSILATDNKPARIQVGTEEPIATGTISQAVGGVANSTSIQYRNTGRIVTIIPQVNSQGLVNLQILAEVSQRRTDTVQVGQDPFPAFDTRQAETTAVVQDGDTLAIGGIIADSKTRSRTGIPYLMDIPVIGRFFGTTSEETDRTELIMLITPNVIRNRGESSIVTEEFKKKLGVVQNEIARMKRDQARQLEKIKKPVPDEQKNAMPETEPPAAVKPVPSPAPAGGVGPKAELERSLDLSKNVQSAPVREVVQVKPEPKTPAMLTESAPKHSSADVNEGETAVRAVDEAVRPPTAKKSMVAMPARRSGDVAPAPATKEPEVGNAKAGQTWSVQVASYGKEADARFFADKLREKGYKVYVAFAAIGSQQPRYRVEVGPLTQRGEAEAIQKELATVHQLVDAFVLTRSGAPRPVSQRY